MPRRGRIEGWNPAFFHLRALSIRQPPALYALNSAKSYLRRHDASAGRKTGTKQARALDVIIEIPYHRLSRASIVKQVIRLAVAIKVRHAHDGPADRKSGAVQTGAENVVVKVPYRRLSRA